MYDYLEFKKNKLINYNLEKMLIKGNTKEFSIIKNTYKFCKLNINKSVFKQLVSMLNVNVLY